MNGLQWVVDGMSAQWQRERAQTQMTLGGLIDRLKQMPPDAPVANLVDAHSYRGYYSDIAFEKDSGTRPAAELLSECQSAMGQVFEGYKGGDFMMGASTPVWIADYGCCGLKLINVADDGTIETAEDE